MSKMKTKLENTIAETNDDLQKEKRLRGDVEKVKRKLEADLKVAIANIIIILCTYDLYYFYIGHT